MNKKPVFLIILLIFLLVIGGVFLWEKNKNKNEFSDILISENIFARGDDYEISKTSQGKIIENKKEGLTLQVPESWIIKKYDQSIGFFSPETEFNEYGDFSESVKEKGACVVGVEIYKSQKISSDIPTFAEILSSEIVYIENNFQGKEKNESYENEVIMVGDKKGIKRTSVEKGEVRSIEVEIFAGQTVYVFSSALIVEQKCVGEFNGILETVGIKK